MWPSLARARQFVTSRSSSLMSSRGLRTATAACVDRNHRTLQGPTYSQRSYGFDTIPAPLGVCYQMQAHVEVPNLESWSRFLTDRGRCCWP
jgi:hypothetical protein